MLVVQVRAHRSVLGLFSLSGELQQSSPFSLPAFSQLCERKVVAAAVTVTHTAPSALKPVLLSLRSVLV